MRAARRTVPAVERALNVVDGDIVELAVTGIDQRCRVTVAEHDVIGGQPVAFDEGDAAGSARRVIRWHPAGSPCEAVQIKFGEQLLDVSGPAFPASVSTSVDFTLNTPNRR